MFRAAMRPACEPLRLRALPLACAGSGLLLRHMPCCRVLAAFLELSEQQSPHVWDCVAACKRCATRHGSATGAPCMAQARGGQPADEGVSSEVMMRREQQRRCGDTNLSVSQASPSDGAFCEK